MLNTSIGNLEVATRSRRFVTPRDEHNRLHADTLEFMATIKFVPSDPRLKAVIAASLHQRSTPYGFESLHPTISICAIIPDDSPVFLFVRRGDLNGLVNLFRQGKASLRDRDSRGTPLLHVGVLTLCFLLSTSTDKKQYACQSLRPEICEFLIENGADVDELALRPDQ